MSINQTIRDYIEEFVLYGGTLDSDDTSLIESDMVDSSGAMDIVMYIEGEFNVNVPASDMTPEHLDTVNRLTALVTRLQSVESAA